MLHLNIHKIHRISETLQRLEAQIEREGGDAPTIREDLEDVARRMGLQLDVLRLADARTLHEVLAPGGSGRLWAAAEILYLNGLLVRARGRPDEAEARLVKSRFLFGRVDADLELPEGASSPAERVREIDALTGADGG